MHLLRTSQTFGDSIGIAWRENLTVIGVRVLEARRMLAERALCLWSFISSHPEVVLSLPMGRRTVFCVTIELEVERVASVVELRHWSLVSRSSLTIDLIIHNTTVV